ncbi:MAG: cation transporter [Bacteroidota bacterium]
MTHTYNITGMTCGACQEKVKKALQSIDGVSDVSVDWRKGEAVLTMDKHIAVANLQEALKDYPNYRLSEKEENAPHFVEEEQRAWLQTYKPVLLIFAFITGITLLVQRPLSQFDPMLWMSHFMAGFFLAFSFFKLLNLRGFADSYSTYDIIAKRWRAWGFIYAFIELGLGIAYLAGIEPLAVSGITFLVMSVSLVGVLQSVLNKRKIRCACLGEVFNLPMSTVTIIEDALMILMSLFTLIHLLTN